MPHWVLDGLSWIGKICCIGIPIAFFRQLTLTSNTVPFSSIDPTHLLLSAYLVLNFGIASIGIPVAIWRRHSRRTQSDLRKKSTEIISVPEAKLSSLSNASAKDRLLISIPKNQIFEFEVNEKEIELQRLDSDLDGLSIAHLSDLHFTGRISKSFFDSAIDQVNDMNADIITVTGDLVDEDHLIDWIPSTVGRLEAKQGVFVILGNHDCKTELPRLRKVLAECGLIQLGGHSQLITVRGQHIILAGNELPWIPPAADMTECPSRSELPHLRVLLSHCPDQLNWARNFDFDLMLSGHTHGGQVCLPLLGPVFCPSRTPIEFATDLIFEPPTVLHVSRGISGEIPLRLNCRPEVTKLILRSPLRNRKEYSVDASSTVLNRESLQDLHS